MGEIDDAIERADRESFIRQPPKTLKGKIGYLLKQLGSAKAVAQEIGVTADSVNCYRRGAHKQARADVAAKIDDAVWARWQPQVLKRWQRRAAPSSGITVETRPGSCTPRPSVRPTTDSWGASPCTSPPACISRTVVDAL